MIEASIATQLVAQIDNAQQKRYNLQQHHPQELNESYGKDFDRDTYTCEVRDVLIDHEIDLIAMAGFGTILNKPIYDDFSNRSSTHTHPCYLVSRWQSKKHLNMV